MIDLRDHGGAFGSGVQVDKQQVAFRELRNISTVLTPTSMAFNDEADGIAIIAYNNSTDGYYRLKGYKDNTLNFESGNFSQTINSIARNADFVYYSFDNILHKNKIVPGSPPSGTGGWSAALVGRVNEICVLPNGTVVVNNNNSMTIRVISAAGSFIRDMLMPNYAAKIVADPIESDIVYVSCQGGHLLKVNVSTGSTIWSKTGFNPSGSNANCLLLFNGFLYLITGNANTYKIDTISGSIVQGPIVQNSPSLAIDPYGNVYSYGGAFISFIGKETLSLDARYLVTSTNGADTGKLKLGKKRQYALYESVLFSIKQHFALK